MATNPVNGDAATHPEDLFQLFEAAATSYPSNGILSYPEGDIDSPRHYSHEQLKADVWNKGLALSSLNEFKKGNPIMLHFQDHLDNILWYWATLFAGGIPAMSTPLSSDTKQREAHLQHMFTLLEDPLCLTRRSKVEEFSSVGKLRVLAIEDLPADVQHTPEFKLPAAAPDDIAALMLTSGTTGQSKAVCLTHGQMLASSYGRSTITELPKDSSVLNWVGLDHVAGLLEAHLYAIYLGANQVHVQTRDVVSDPIRFLELIVRHRVGWTFAPNFLLVSLLNAVASVDKARLSAIDLSCLRCLISGGESNPVSVCNGIARLLTELGALENVLVPAFGLSETCAGAFYNMRCPSYDNDHGREYACHGHAVPGIQMRVREHTKNSSPSESNGISQGEPRNVIGTLEVRGPIVFKSYYNNKEATAAAFNEDGWFDTGDQAMIDANDGLHIVGRIKDIIRVNSQSYLPQALEASLNDASLPGAAKNYFVCFSYFPPEKKAERICVIYLPTYDSDDVEARASTADQIAGVIMIHTGTYPYILPVDSSVLHKSTLGKLSRGKVKTAFLEGDLQPFQDLNEAALSRHRESSPNQPKTETEAAIMKLVSEAFEIDADSADNKLNNVNQSLMEFGMSSLQLIRLQKRIEQHFDLDNFSLTTLIRNPTARSLAEAISNTNQSTTYNPVVTLRSSGSKPPLWLFPPGHGEILVFFNLANLITDRPVYALRARGFNTGEPFFKTLSEAIDVYSNAIKTHQPTGPYALAGYSYGTILAFETAKRLESTHASEVKFLGSMDLPPHIKTTVRHPSWTACLLHLAYSIGLVSEHVSRTLLTSESPLGHNEQADAIISQSEAARLRELGLTSTGLVRWTDLYFANEIMVEEYEPRGKVSAMDVFYCEPLPRIAASKEVWFDEHISKWKEFTETEARFHEVEGDHYTMISPENVESFYDVLQRALAGRGM